MTRDDLLAALMVERYGHTHPQWHGPYGVPPETAELMRIRWEMEQEEQMSEVDVSEDDSDREYQK